MLNATKLLKSFIRDEAGSTPALYLGMVTWAGGFAIAGLYAVWPSLSKFFG